MLTSSGGGHDYLYGLFFLMVAPVIGAATRHFLRVPLPFTVLLLIFGLAMGALNRAYGPHGGHDTVPHMKHIRLKAFLPSSTQNLSTL